MPGRAYKTAGILKGSRSAGLPKRDRAYAGSSDYAGPATLMEMMPSRTHASGDPLGGPERPRGAGADYWDQLPPELAVPPATRRCREAGRALAVARASELGSGRISGDPRVGSRAMSGVAQCTKICER